MEYTDEIYQRSLRGLAGIDDKVDASMYSFEDIIRNWIRERWLKGLRPDGSLIGLYASEDYAEDKFKISSEAGFGNVDLTLTGSLGRNIQISGYNQEYEIFSTDSKYLEIKQMFGDSNFNVTKEQEKELFERVLNDVLTELINETYG